MSMGLVTTEELVIIAYRGAEQGLLGEGDENRSVGHPGEGPED